MNLKNIRIKLLLTQEEFAKKIDVVPQLISQWERGIKSPSMRSLRKVKQLCEENNIPFEVKDEQK